MTEQKELQIGKEPEKVVAEAKPEQPLLMDLPFMDPDTVVEKQPKNPKTGSKKPSAGLGYTADKGQGEVDK